MYNSDTPSRAELPSSRQLVRSTLLAAVSAVVLLVVVVLPAEYGVDPTGIGKVLRLTEMGNIKQGLAAEAAVDAALKTGAPVGATANATPPAAAEKAAGATVSTAPSPTAVAPAPAAPAQPAAAQVAWRDEMPFTLAPGQGTEIKLKMAEGAKAQYQWVVEGGMVNFDTHGDGPGKSISYEKGRGVASDEGTLEAAFTGNHGWYWRNRGKSPVKVVLRARGDYTDIKRVL